MILAGVVSWLTTTGVRAAAAPVSLLEAEAALERGQAALRRRESAPASAEFGRALRAGRAASSDAAQGEALVGLALAHWYESRRDQAERCYRRALPLLRRAGRRQTVALAELGLGLVAATGGRPAEAVGHFQDGRLEARRIGSRALEASALHQLARVHERLGELARAESCSRRRLAISLALHDQVAAAHAWSSLGRIRQQRGRHRAALQAYDEALAGARVTADRSLEAAVLNDQGRAYEAQGDRRAARHLYAEARRTAAEAAAPISLVRSLENLAQLAVAEGRAEKARRVVAHARAIAARSRLGSEVHDG
jgi:tetratricopeptide (TPR) repeat protein